MKERAALTEIASKVSSVLCEQVRQPAQYIGGEINQVVKDWDGCSLRVALAFPDTYTVGMSHLGTAILYEAVNRMEGVLAERVFCPWLDAAAVMREAGLPLFSWETRRAVRDFDVVGITLQHEMSFTNVVHLLDLAGITRRAEQRGDDEPLVIGGGPIADSAEAAADFFDAIVLGDGEESFPALLRAYEAIKGSMGREDVLGELARQFEWLYVPRLYACDYGDDGVLRECKPIYDDVREVVTRAAVADLDTAVFPRRPLVANAEAIHDRIAIEIMRGCPGRCAFCHAGHTKGKLRWRSVEEIVAIAKESYEHTGHDTISLLSLSTSDYPELRRLLEELYAAFEGKHVSLSLPSLRVDKQLHEVPEQVTSVRREGLTVAVEAATDRLRQAIGKKVTDEDLMATMEAAFRAGWKKVKLYFMAGFPGETEEDVMGIVDLSARISRLGKGIHGAPAAVSAAVSWLVPKPHTPLQWAGQADIAYCTEVKKKLIAAKRQLRGAAVQLKFHHIEQSHLEGVFSRGDRRLSRVIERAYDKGAVFDSWHECFSYERWFEVFEECGVERGFYGQRERGDDEYLPWEHLGGDNKEALGRRWKKIREIFSAGDEQGG